MRQVLELRRNGYTLVDLLKDHPELKPVGVAEAFAHAAADRERYAEFFEADGSLAGPGYTEDEAAALPERLRIPGVVIKGDARPGLSAQTRAASSSGDTPGPAARHLAGQLGAVRPPDPVPVAAPRPCPRRA